MTLISNQTTRLDEDLRFNLHNWVFFLLFWVIEPQVLFYCLRHIILSSHNICPLWTQGIVKISHEHVCSGVQPVNYLFAQWWRCYLNHPLCKIFGLILALPWMLTDGYCVLSLPDRLSLVIILTQLFLWIVQTVDDLEMKLVMHRD